MSASAASGPATVDGDEGFESRASLNWVRLLRTISRVRRLQRLYGQLGNFLKEFGSDTRNQLRTIYTKDK
jgi:hypothetical protein